MIKSYPIEQEAIVPAPRQATRGRNDGGSRTSSRSKRENILTIATAYFGEHGYEDTKWADVAAAVGIGSTALYHYFESKLHCLYVIMADALASFQDDFERITTDHDEFLEALVAVLRSGYELTEQEVLRNRVLVAEQGLVGIPRQSRREEEARELARARTRDLEFAWATFLVRGMEQGHMPQADAPCSASTTACGTGTGHGARWASARSRTSSSAVSWRCSRCRPSSRASSASAQRRRRLAGRTRATRDVRQPRFRAPARAGSTATRPSSGTRSSP
jgi:AcrR family transcriptional regulator